MERKAWALSAGLATGFQNLVSISPSVSGAGKEIALDKGEALGNNQWVRTNECMNVWGPQQCDRQGDLLGPPGWRWGLPGLGRGP